MCLEIIVSIPGESRETLHDIAGRCTAAGPLEVVVFFRGWFWRSHALRISEPGRGCACSMLSDDAVWTETYCAMRPEARARLAAAVRQLCELLKADWTFEARWDPPPRQQAIAGEELVRRVGAGEIEMGVRYLVRSKPA